MDREQRLRLALKADADQVQTRPELWDRIEHRTRRRPPQPRRVAFAAAAAVLIVIALIAANLFGERQVTDVVGTPEPGLGADYFEGFWPVSIRAEAERMQAEADAGEETWGLDVYEVALGFADRFIGWAEVDPQDSVIDGSPEQGWQAEVEVLPLLGEGDNMVRGAPHTVSLVGLSGAEEPVWFVTGIRSAEIEVDHPNDGQTIASPVLVSGRARAYEGTVHTEIRDDSGAVLHEGFVMGAQDELGPFEQELEFSPPTAGAGIVVLMGDTGIDGPSPAWTIVRVRFVEAQEAEYFEGFWPVTTRAEAEEMQARADAGEDTLGLDPRDVALGFADRFIGWPEVDPQESSVEGSAETGWVARVEVFPLLGEGEIAIPGTRHMIWLVGLRGAERPVWFVARVLSDDIELHAPRYSQVISSSVTVSGRSRSYEATVHTQVRDDRGAVLHEGFVVGGATELEPFEGSLTFDPPATSAGIVVLTSDTGIDGPSPAWTIVRVRFSAGSALPSGWSTARTPSTTTP